MWSRILRRLTTQSQSRAPTADDRDHAPRAVLIVGGDDPLMRRLERALRIGGHGVVRARDLPEAIVSAEATLPDIVVLDAESVAPSPDQRNVSSWSRLRGRKDAPVLLLLDAKKVATPEVVRAWQSGVDGVLPKPFTDVELLGVTNRLLNGPVLPDTRERV